MIVSHLPLMMKKKPHDTQPLKPPFTHAQPIPPPSFTSFNDAYANSVTAQITELKAGQDRLFEQHN